eukprot:comp21659_c0_seq1/m.30459 comp21659_c0_seq1/g.30459  ORF comp21659_c0_seq1/g.30459 comp21659_c0_seq1/m.30459 type:complete len:581 (-) comp21659_c0_seq1:477-2219(-)
MVAMPFAITRSAALGARRFQQRLAAPAAAAYLHSSARRNHIFKAPFADLDLVYTTIPEHVLGLSTGPVSKYGDSLAFKTKDGSMTYNQLKQNTLSFAQTLQTKFGVKRGSMVAIHMGNCPEMAVALHGTMASGAVATTVNPSCTAWELAYQMENSGATTIITSANLLPTVLEANEQINKQLKSIIVVGDEPTGNHIPYASMIDNDGSLWKPVEVDVVNDVAVLPYSSGTTGRPKGVMLTHFNIVTNCRQATAPELMTVGPGTGLMGMLPFYHQYGMVVLAKIALEKGATVSCLQKFDPNEFCATVQRDKLDILPIVPPVAVFLAKSPIVDNYDLSSVREMVSAAAPLSKEVTDQLYARLPKLEVIRQGYGMTELSPFTHYDYLARSKMMEGSGGVLVPNTLGKVVDLATGKELGPGESGEICVKGPQVMKGYWKNEKATKETIDRDGWLHTGDIGHMRESGHLFIEDRVKELIKVKGHQVAPAELEALLLSNDNVADVCVVQKPDERAGELPKAFVVKKPNSTVSAEEVRVWANKHVSHYKHLAEIEFIDAIPKTLSGKILRRVLRDQEKEKAAKQAAAA